MNHRFPVRLAKAAERCCMVVGSLCLLWGGAALVRAHTFQRDAARQFDRNQAADAAPSAVTPVATVPEASGHGGRAPERSALAARTRSRAHAATGPRVVGRVEVPAVRLVAMVAEGLDDRTLAVAVGHMPGSTLPGGRPGRERTTVLAGHRDSFFRGLEHVRRGDVVRLSTRRGTFTYRVVSLRIVDPGRAGVLRSGPAHGLTLVTCYPFRWVGPAPMRYVVQAAPLRFG